MLNATFGSLTRDSRRFLYSLLRKKALIMSALLVFVQLLTPVATIYAAATVSNDIGSAASLDPVGNKATRLQGQGSSGVDQSSGALTYTYPLTLPDGRNGMAPKLSLSYNSQNNDSGWFGHAWTINIPYVERTTKTGSDKMYSNPVFVSSLHGELTSSNGINYEQKVDDGSYPKYTYSGNTWQMTDRDGTTYYFGNTYTSRIQDDAGTLIGRWYLTEVRDKFGNGILYGYTKDSGTVYPSTVSYTEHALAHPLNLVSFTLENKTDQLPSYKYGFKTTDTKRVSAIKVSTNGKDNSYFYFTYTFGSNGVRSLLQSIEKKHLSTNGDWTTLPKTTFDYEKSAPSFSGTISNSVNPYGGNVVMDTDGNGILDLYNAGDGYFPVEINGDYKKDLVQAEITYGAYSSGQNINFKYNQGSSTFLLRNLKKPTSSAYIRSMVAGNPIPPLRYLPEGGSGWGQESVVADVNGDGFDDVVYNDPYGNNGVGVNTTNNTFDYSTPTNLWFSVLNDQLVDINGDGLQDKISKSTSGTTTYSIYLNTGSGYSTTTYYVYSTGTALPAEYDTGVRFVDINNDGLVDFVRSYYSNYSGTGNPTCTDSYSPVPTTAPINQSVSQYYINTGTGFTASTSPLSGYIINYGSCAYGMTSGFLVTKSTKEYDTDGDLDTDYDGATNNTKKQDVLTNVTSSLGSTLSVSYSWTTTGGLNPTLPVPMYTVATTTEKFSLSDPAPHIVSYSFQDGQMYYDDSAPRDHKFAGFGKVEVVDGNKKTVTYFHQGNGDNLSTGEKGDSYYNIGKSYRTDTFDLSSGTSTLVSKDLSLYTTYSYASSSFTYLDSQIKNLYNSDGSYVSSASRNVYDETKRLIKTSYNYGDIEPFISFASSTITDKGSDLTVTSYIYSNTRPQRLVKQTTTDYSGQTIGNTAYYYDGLPYGLVDKGAVTTTLDTIYNSDGTVNATSSTQVEYDPTGNVTKTTDALGNITKVSYDSSYYFPTQKVDALNGTTTYSYDPYTLNLLSTKGPDGITYTKETDGLGKVTRSYTLDSGGGVHDEVRINYVYGGGLTVYTRKMGSSGQEARSVDIYDSYGRLIQSKKESTVDSFSTQDTTYDASSNVTSVSLPYITTGYGYTPGTPTNGKTIYTYDGLGRVTTKEAFGSKATYQYGARSLTVQDNASTQHKKTYIYDANGNLATVQEYNNGSTYTTSYSYTPTNKLSRISDANGNIRNFSYLSNGLLTYQEDSHPSSDSTFTTYSYTYDSLGNLLSKIGPLGSIIYSYDALSRPTTRVVSDATNGTSTVSLSYTGCANNYVSPCVINRGTSSTTLTYNSYGKLGSEMLSIDGKTYTRSYAYDTFSNPTTITYPDNGQAIYSYTLDGKQASLSYITPSGSTKSIVSNTTFNSIGDLSSYSLGNGIQLCNTYTTTSTDGVISPKLGKSVYLFNSVGCSLSGSNQVELYKDEFTYKDYMTPSNILTTYKDIAGTTHTKSDSFTYDNLARLTQTSTSYDGGGALVDSLVYDPIGNIISENNVLYRYSKDGMQNANAVTSIGGVNVSYDSQGNRIQSGDNSYAWNTLNQLVLATSSNGTERYTYDENGERLKKVVQASVLINQKVTPSTTGLAISTLSQGDLLAQVATSSTYIATSTYNTLSSLSLLDKTSLFNLVTGYYASPFTSKFCAATSTANRQTCISDTTKQLLANDINQRSTSTVATTGLITDIIKISTGEYLIPSSYVGIATSSIAISSQATFTVNSGTISSYNTYVATGIVVALDQYSNLPYVSTSTYTTLASLGLIDTTKVKTVMILAGCNSVASACTTAKKVIFEKYYKESGYLLSDRALQEMWYVYAAKARLPGNSTELTSTSTYLGSISVPSVTSRSSSSATSTYYSGLYFTTEYTNQNTAEPRLQYFNTIPYYITPTAFGELQAAGITQTTVQSYQSQIDDLLSIKYASSTEYMVALQSFAKNDKGVTLSWNTLKELYLVVIGAASIPNNTGDYTQNAVYDLSNYLVINSYKTVSGQFTLQWTTACNGGYVSSLTYSRCVIGTSPFSLSVSSSTSVSYILSLKNSPNPTETTLLMGSSTNTTMGTDSYNYATDLPHIFNGYYTQTFSSDGVRIDADVTPTILTQQASSTSPLKILISNDSQWSSDPYTWEATSVTLKAYANTSRLTLASTTLVSGVTNATTTSFTAGIQSTIASYFGENHDSSFDVSTGTTSPLVFISPESYREFASTTLKDAYQITKVFMATSTTQCASAASTTECDKTLRKAAFREIVTNLSGFTPSQAATEEFWMVHKGILALPNVSFASTTATTTVNGYYQATSTIGSWYIMVSPGNYTYYVATSSAVLPAIVSSTSTPYPVFARSNLPNSLSTSTTYLTSTTTIPGFWVDQVVYQDSPTGGATSTTGSYTVHTFNSSGTFTVPSGASFNAEVLAVGGGGGGGGSQGGGGGGGQVIASSTVAFTAGSYSVTIGSGGGGGDAGGTTAGGDGATTTFVGITAKGGKGAPRQTNLNGGNSGSGKTGGTGILSGYYPSGGGAGDFANGVNGSGSASGNGGTGTSSSITGSSLGYGGGGGGGGDSQGSTPGSGVDGGGNGATAFVSSPGSSGTANRGGGGGGGSNDNGCHCAGTAGGDGGSGVVIVRYLTSLFPFNATTTTHVYIATTTIIAPVTHLDLVPSGVLTDTQFTTTYATSSFALATTTKGVSQDTYNELLRTPVRLNSDVTTVFTYALPFATSSCPGQTATSSCVITAQKTKAKDTISALSGFVLSDAALEELYRVNSGDLSIIPMNLTNAATSSSNQTIILPLDKSRAYTSYSTSTASGTTTSSVGGSCSFGTTGATTTKCKIGLPDLNTIIQSATFKYDLSTSTVSTSTLLLNFTYLTQVASTTGATSTPQFTAVSSSTTVTGQKSGTSTFSFDLSSYYVDFMAATTSTFILTPDANGTSTQVFQVLNPILTFNRYISNQSITYATTTQFIPFDRSAIPSYATTTATTSIDLTNTPPIELSMMFSPEAGTFVLNSTPSTYLVGNTGMVAYYKLDSNSNDAAGSTNGSDTNITYSSGNGKLNNGAGFNGTNSTVALGTGLNLAGGGMTIAGWVYINTNSLYQEAILNKRDVGGTMQYQFYVENSAAKLAFYTGTQYNSTSAVGSNGWHHVAVTLSNSSNGNLTFYIDGVQSGTASSVNLGSGTSARVAIGSQGSADYDFFHGAIDELGVWSRTLSSTEIANLYNSGSGLAYPFATVGSSRQESYAGSEIDDSYLYSTSTQNILPAVSYPYATSTATSTVYSLTTATTTSYTLYTPFSNYQDDSRGTITSYLTFNGKLIAAYTYQSGQEASTGKLTYILVNYLGTPVLSTDAHGDITEMDVTDSFGNYVHRDRRNDNAEHTRGFTNQDFDDVTGLNYFHARLLDPKAHTFLSVDPVIYNLVSNNNEDRLRFVSALINPQAQNSYSYVGNNPITNIDQDGRWWVEVSASLAGSGRTGSIGFRFDDTGIDYFQSGGFTAGSGAFAGIVISPYGSLSHQAQSTTNVTFQAAKVVGGQISGDLATYSVNAKSMVPNDKPSGGIIFGLGASASVQQEVSTPLVSFGKNTQPTNSVPKTSTNAVQGRMSPQSIIGPTLPQQSNQTKTNTAPKVNINPTQQSQQGGILNTVNNWFNNIFKK